jgi:hypothetical protein
VEQTNASPVTLIPDLTAFLIDAVQRRTSEEAIRTLVEKQIEGVVERAVVDQFRSYGNITKSIQEQLAAALVVPALDLPAYGHMVMSLVRAKLDENLNDLLKTQISAQLDEMLSIAPAELKLSDVVEAMREYRKSEVEYDQWSRFHVDVEEPSSGAYSSSWVKLHCEKREESRYSSTPDKHFHEVRFLASNSGPGKISALTIDQRDVDSIYRLGHMSKWKRMIFAAYCCKTPFIIDKTDFDTEIDEGED